MRKQARAGERSGRKRRGQVVAKLKRVMRWGVGACVCVCV